jgi:hypothetical protein
MQELLHGNPGIIVPATLFLCITLVSITSVIATRWQRVRQLEIEAALKHEMIERGMSVDEIRQVLETPLAGTSSRRRSACYR